MPLGTDVDLGPGDYIGLRPGDFVRWGPTTPPQKGGAAPQFSAHACCGKTLGIEYGKAFFTFFTARRNARIASAVLATATPSSVRPSVRPSVRLSVTREYCVKTTARSTVQFALSDSKMCLVL